MRGAPQVEFSATMPKIGSRTFVDSPTDPFSHLREQTPVQSKSGAMPANHSFRSDHQERPFPVGPKPIRQHPEELVKGLSFGLACLRFSTASYWRSARFFRSSLRRERKQRATSPKLSRAKLHMHHSHSKSCDEEIVQTVDFGPGQSFGDVHPGFFSRFFL